ncbi:hypothetical protein GW17_00028898 [Ensete ventricosum]|nr:hypothetical protein GW17_00028898 [Ensete ventricosum]
MTSQRILVVCSKHCRPIPLQIATLDDLSFRHRRKQKIEIDWKKDKEGLALVSFSAVEALNLNCSIVQRRHFSFLPTLVETPTSPCHCTHACYRYSLSRSLSLLVVNPSLPNLPCCLGFWTVGRPTHEVWVGRGVSEGVMEWFWAKLTSRPPRYERELRVYSPFTAKAAMIRERERDMWVGLTRRWWRGRLSRGEWSRTVAEEEHAAVLRGGRKALGGLCSAFRGTRRDEAISTPTSFPPSSSHLYLSISPCR